MAGYIKIHRKMAEWGWYQDGNTFRVFIHLLMQANYKDSEYRGYKIRAGQCVCGRKQLAAALNISERSVRTALEHLKQTNEISIKTTNKFSVVTIENWEKYQVDEAEPTNNRPTTDQQLTNNRPTTDHIQEVKKERKKEYIYRDVPEEIKEPFMEWAEMRKQIKKPITSKQTVTRALNTLNKLSKRTDTQIAIINQSIDRCWASFYELKKGDPKPKAYREFEKDTPVDAVGMPDSIRKRINEIYG